MSLALTFPGQGSQSVGMLQTLAAEFPVVEETFAAASEVLGYDLWLLVQQGPEEKLNQTERTQPAMLASDVAVLRVLQTQATLEPAVVAGHSLGEYAALVCAGCLAFETAVDLVRERGRLMQEAVREGEGAIAAILGLQDDTVKTLCEQAREGQVVAAVNFNAPGQVAVAGHAGAVDRLVELARRAGAKRAIKLALSVPVHCDLMKPAAERFSNALESVAISEPKFKVIHNVDVREHRSPADIRRVLTEQVYSPVRWTETVSSFADSGVATVLELGPGKVLSGLCKRIDKTLTALPVFDPDSVAKAVETLGG